MLGWSVAVNVSASKLSSAANASFILLSSAEGSDTDRNQSERANLRARPYTVADLRARPHTFADCNGKFLKLTSCRNLVRMRMRYKLKKRSKIIGRPQSLITRGLLQTIRVLKIIRVIIFPTGLHRLCGYTHPQFIKLSTITSVAGQATL